MRDTLIARRALLALAAGIAAGIGPIGPIRAQLPAKGRSRNPRTHPRIVALDPGHGGVDPGAISPHGIYEKNLTLPTARELARQLEANQASDRDTAALAIRENKDDFVAGVHLSRQPRVIGAILLDLARRQTNNRSLTLARAVVEELGRAVPLLETPHRAAGFAVLTAPDMPSALVELGCLSNPTDERLLPQRAHQQRLAHGLARAVDDYFAAIVTARA